MLKYARDCEEDYLSGLVFRGSKLTCIVLLLSTSPVPIPNPETPSPLMYDSIKRFFVETKRYGKEFLS